MNKKNTKYPSIAQQAKNLTEATGKILGRSLSGDDVLVSNDVHQSRIEICKRCDKYDQYQKRCYECGCFIDVKARFVIEQCPLDKWNETETDEVKTESPIVDAGNYKEEDIPTPPKNPEEGEIYRYKGKRWKYSNDVWEFIVD
jgi:hypothetical protein